MRTLYADNVTVKKNPVTKKEEIIPPLQPDGKRDDRNKDGQPDLDRVGHQHLNETVAYGGIVIKGKIIPERMDHMDFNRALGKPTVPAAARESFNWVRLRTVREYIISVNGQSSRSECQDNELDDAVDDDEDLTPEDGFLWVFNTPAIYTIVAGDPRSDTGPGEVARGRVQFLEEAQYAGVKVSATVPWFWRYSIQNLGASMPFRQENSLPGDNQVQGNAFTPLTPALRPGFVPPC